MWLIEAPKKTWNKTGGMTPGMASTASTGALKSDESETMPPIIVHLHNITCPPPLRANPLQVLPIQLLMDGQILQV